MGTIDIRLDGARETFGKKKQLLGLSIEKQVELLNKLYDGLLTFNIMHMHGDGPSVSLDINEGAYNVRILEIPEVDDLDPTIINLYNCKNLITLKLPKTVEKIDVGKWSLYSVKNIWIWDTTEVVDNGTRWGNNKINLFIRSTTSDKVDVYRNV